MDFLETKLNDEDLERTEVEKYLLKDKQLSIHHLTLCEKSLDDFYTLYYDFINKVKQLEKQNEENKKSLLFVDSVLPLKTLLKNFINKMENKQQVEECATLKKKEI